MKYIIGDIHSNIFELNKLLGILNLTSEDTCIFLGDYVGKNTHTTETVRSLKEIRSLCNCVFLKGNHDYVWERYLLHGETFRNDFLIHHGDVLTLEQFSSQSYKLLETNQTEKISNYLSEYCELLPYLKDYYIVGDYIATHAGIAPNNLDKQDLVFEEGDYFLRPDKMLLDKQYLGKYTVVAGHTFIDEIPTFKRGYINIDLGAGYGKYIGAFSVEQSSVIRSDGQSFEYKP